MVVKKIDDDRIKVFVSEEELRRFNVNFENVLDFENVVKMTRSANELFWAAMSQAEQQVNFRVDNSQLLVEANTDGQNGFTMTITKVAQNGTPTSAAPLNRPQSESRPRQMNATPKVRRKGNDKITLVFRFENFDHVCMALKRLDLFYLGESRLYKLENEFYLHISTKFAGLARKVRTVLSEYACVVSSHPGTEGKLNEYGEVMIGDYAIEKVATYF